MVVEVTDLQENPNKYFFTFFHKHGPQIERSGTKTDIKTKYYDLQFYPKHIL